MSDHKIHPTAIVEAGAKLASSVRIEPYAIVKAGATLEEGVTIKAHAYIDGNTFIGEGSTIWPSVVIGTQTQDKKFQGEYTEVRIGKNCEIREFTTINSSCGEGGFVSIGDDCLIMACCHVAHNCVVGDRVIMSNNAILAGHVTVEDDVRIGGMTPIHQFCRIGRWAMVGGFSRVTHDVPPFTLGAGIPFKLGGLNLVGLKRNKFSLRVRGQLSKAFKLVYRSGLHLEDALKQIERDLDSIPELQHWVRFCRESKRGLIGLHGINQVSSHDLELYEEEEQLEPAPI